MGKHNKLRQSGLQVDKLSRGLEQYEIEVETMVMARAALQSRKVYLTYRVF